MANKKKFGLGKSNPVAKFQRKFNKAVVMTDRKKESKKNGHDRGRRYCVDKDFYDSAGGDYEHL